MDINPHAWLISVPLTVALIQFALLPADHALKRCWQMMRELEDEVWFRLNRGLYRPDPAPAFRHHAIVYRAVIVAFAAVSILSFATFVGVLS